ncbi:MAG TPA: glutamate decarboxylase [Firmicutes bacterium]|nr:glutamate decarboxylase [Bacillota bacterium]HBE07038.1 glutamate decarboxylase [Bacillota bacterium]HBR23398.1 glutamate decarboxylase [Bacillota bacterium]HCT37254.1 glutamate decarboxylase [Bacillota bacterium]
MWAVVYVAPNEPIATMIKEYLTKEGFLVTIRHIGLPHFGASGSVEVLVPEGEVEEAQEILSGAFDLT